MPHDVDCCGCAAAAAFAAAASPFITLSCRIMKIRNANNTDDGMEINSILLYLQMAGFVCVCFAGAIVACEYGY